MSRVRNAPLPLIVWPALVLTLSLSGCSGNTTTSARFTQSATAQAPGLIKLVQTGGSGRRLVVDALLFGPEPALDVNEFKFAIRIGDPTLVKFVTQASYMQSVLVAGAGQTIAIDIDGTSDPSLVQVDVRKLGGGAGNGVAAAAVAVIQLTFDVQGSGQTTLTLTGSGANPPQAFDSTGNPIAVTFDAASAGVTGVTTGGGY